MTTEYSKQDKEFDTATGEKLDAWTKELTKADAVLLRKREELYKPLWEKRDEIINKIDGFWPQAIANHEGLAAYFDDVDHPLIAKLTGIKIHRDVEDPRATKVEFIFADNDYLSENSLVKEFQTTSESKDLGDSDFDWTDDLKPIKTEIKWKSDEKNLCKLKPTSYEDEETFTPGSFFSSFFECTHPEIANGIGQLIAESFYPMALDWYTGDAADDDDFDFDDESFSDEEDSEDESEDDGAAEIDLEEKDAKPAKRARTEQ